MPITAERLIGMMDAIGVDAALLTSPSPYGNDHSYAFDAADRFPGRFGVVGPIKEPESADVEDRVRAFKAEPERWRSGSLSTGPTTSTGPARPA